jgi:hypothetical protein
VAERLSEYSSEYDWVRVKALRKVNLEGGDWSNGRRVPVSEGEITLLPRGRKGKSTEEFPLGFYFQNDGFFKIVETEPDLENNVKQDEYVCGDCEDGFDSKKGLDMHRRQKHKSEEEAE